MDAAVMIMAYGGPRSLDEVEPFMRELMGREPSPEALERVKRRYLTIGGKSPLPEVARDIASELEEQLAKDGHEIAVAVGFRYSQPTIAETLQRLYEGGARRVVTISLSPLESETTSVAYRQAVDDASAELPGLEVIETQPISTLTEFEILLAGGLAVALEHLPSDVGDSKIAILTAHSLPVADLPDPDPYCEGLRSLAAALAHGLGMDPGSEFSDDAWLPGVSGYGTMTGELPWLIAFQSKGQRECDWLGPELGDVLEAVAEAGIKGVVVQPIGFVTDHMETLYDLDVEAGGKAMDLDLEFERGRVPNASPILVEGLLRVVGQALGLPTREPLSAVEGHLTS